MEQYKIKAEELFRKGYNCAQAVVAAFLGEDSELLKLAAPFGGGMGRMRLVCGAVSGMFMVTGHYCGYDDPAAAKEKRDLYEMEQTLAARFTEQCGSIICGELLGTTDTNPNPERRTAAYYQKRPCVELVGVAADILSDFLQEQGIL